MKCSWLKWSWCFTALIFLILAGNTFAQTVEICNDGKDNNGDGKIDCNDSQCIFPPAVEKGCHCFDNIDNDGDGKIDAADTDCASYYGLSFVGSGSTCSITPPPGNSFSTIAPPQTSSQNTADTPAKIVVGDMNGDGMPDAVVTSKWNSTIQVVATATASGFSPGDIMGDFRTPGSKIFPKAGSNYVFEHEVLIADIDKDKIGEMFAIVSERGGSPNNGPVRFYLTGFKYANKNLIPLWDAVDLGPDRPGSPGIADFDGDGKAEVYLRSRIYAAESGKLLADGGGPWDTQVNAGPVAVNIEGGPQLELVCGPLIYSVPNLSSRTLQTLTIVKNFYAIGPQYFPKGYLDVTEYGVDQASTTSTADMNGDGFIDVLMTGAINCSGNEASPCGNSITTIFFWNVHTGDWSTFTPTDPSYPANGWPWGTGRINLGDANGDGKLEALFVSGNQLFCLGLDAAGRQLILLWKRTINDSLSGILSLTVYDFNNDGQPEVVYRDSQELVIVDGLTGQTKLWSASCQSHTYTEGPVVADVNGDGNTDICVPCYTNAAFDINKSTAQQQSLGQTRIYYSSTNAWLPTRKVWNQHPYYVTNINDNLTLPFPQIDPSLVFSTAPCPTGLPGPQRPLNLFMNQVPHLSKDGCPEFPAPDLTFTGDDPANPGVDANGDGVYTPTVVVTPPICGDTKISAYFNIINNGDLPITDNVPVSFFNGDPTANPVAATLLYSTTIGITNLQIGQKLVTPTLVFNGPGSIFKLYIVLYNNGSVLPISLTGGSTKECSISNNIYSVLVSPDPFQTTVEKISDNFKCSNAAPDDGELRGHIFKGGVEVTDYSPYAFQWYTGTGTGSPIAAPAGTDYNITNRAEGTYTLVVTNTQKGCVGAPVSQSLVRLGNDPVVNVTVVSDQTKCSPQNGQLSASVVGGNTGFTFNWFDVSLTPLGITGPTANNLGAGSYVVFVSKDGCSKASTPVTIAGPQIPDAQASVLQNVIDCSNPLNGSVTADAVFNSVVQNPSGYTFDWYFYNNATSTQGSILPPINGTGQTRTGLAVGYYQAVIKDISTQCISGIKPVVQVMNQTVLPTASITEIAPQTSCDPLNPNGILSGSALIGGVVQNPATFTFEWFKGDNTLPVNLVTTVSGINGQVANKVSGGGVYYTVKVTSAQHCSATNKYIITETINVPVLTLTPTNNSICNPALASSNFNGSVAAAISFAGTPVGSFSNYKFTWHKGSLVTDPVIVVADNTLPLLSQQNGGYYTVQVQRTDLSCTSNPVTVQVLNLPVLPLIVVTPTPSTNCSGAPNGALSAVVDLGGGIMTTTGYTFKWYLGNTTAGAVVGATASVSGLQGGLNYTVEVVNSASGCSSTQTLLLPDAKALPVVTLTPNPNGICNPALTNPAAAFNGSVVATVTYKGVSVVSFTDYNFQWHNGSLVTDPVNPASTNQNLNNLNGGFYTVTANIVSLGCTSSAVTSQVLNTPVNPVITTSTTPSTNCDPLLKNGQTAVTDVDGVGVGSPYTFKWYDGNVVVPGSEKSLAATYLSLQGGAGKNYTVLVTNQNNGCQTNKTLLLADNKVLPVVTLSETDNINCTAPKNGTATINTLTYQAAPVSAPYTGYTFAWNNGATTSAINGVASGIYTLTVNNVSVGCISSPVSITVNDNLFTPLINIADTPQTSCNNAAPNGVLAATVDETSLGGGGGGGTVTLGYTFTWHAGTLLTDPTVTTTTGVNGEVNKLPGNKDYLVEAIRASTGCKNTKSFFLPETIVYPGVTFTTVTPLTRCDAPNGAITATVLQVPVQTYTFFWMQEQPLTTTTNPATVITAVNTSPVFPNRKNTGASGANADTFGSLIPGSYTIVVVDNYTTCISQPVTGTVIDNSLKSTINITLGPTFPSTCGVSDGQISALITGGVGPFDIFWHHTGPINSNINFFTNPPAFTPPNDVPFATALGTTSSSLINIGSDIYTLVVTDNGNGCGNYETAFLPFLSAHTITPTVTPSTICPITAGNGDIKVTLGNIAVGKTFQDYTYKLYSGQNPDPAKQLGVVIGPGGAVTSPQDFPTALTAGQYTVEVTQAFSGLCPVYELVDVLQNALAPDVTLVGSLKANSSCDILQADGSATIDIEKNASDVTVGSTYTVDISPLPITGGPYPLSGLSTGNFIIGGMKPSGTIPQYTITVTSSNNCVTQRLVTIPDQPSVSELVAGNMTIKDADLCSPSGSAEVTAITVVGGGADNINNYLFKWFSDITQTTNVHTGPGDNTATKGGEVLDNTTFPGIGPGSFWVVALKNAVGQPGFGCISAPFKADIKDISIKPTVNLTAITNSACDANYEGKIEVRSTNGGLVGTAGPYTYVWDPANATAIATSNNNNGNGVNDGGDADNPTSLQEGLYNVRVTNNVTFCFTDAQVSLLQSATPVVIATATTLDQQLCIADGSITIGPNDVTVNGTIDGVHNNFVFDWYLSDPNGVAIVSGAGKDVLNPVTFATIGAGDYYVTATRAPGINPGSGCKSAPLKATIKDISIKPTIGFTVTTNTSCDNNFDAKITVKPATASGPGQLSNYDLTWTSVPAGSTAANAINTTSPYSTIAPDNIGPGSYSVHVVNRGTQCVVDGITAIVSNPQPLSILTVSKADQTICFADGNISVSTLNSGALGNYSFNWFRGTPASTALTDPANVTITAPAINTTNYTTMGAGTFYVVATKTGGSFPGSGCSTPPFRVDILDLHKDPVTAFTFQPNSSCDNLNPNATVLANAKEQNGTNTDTYSFAWNLNGAALPGVTTEVDTNNSSQLTNGFEGLYGLTIINTTTTGCQFTSGIPVDLNLQISLPNIIGVSKIDPIDCLPSASAQITSVSIGGGPPVTGPALVTNFTYEWYANNFTPADILPASTPTIAGLTPGFYYALVQDNTTKCKSGPREVQIVNTNIIYPVVNVTQTAKQISCIAISGTAALAATGDGQTDLNPAYTFAWFPSLDETGISFASTSTISNLLVGNYSVKVTNNTTACFAAAAYIVPDDGPAFTPVVSLGGQPRTICVGQDGAILARVVNIDPAYPFPFNFTADLYNGGNPNLSNPPDSPNLPKVPGFNTNFQKINLLEGIYSVRITDNNTGCFAVATDQVLDKRVLPVVTIIEDNPLTNCDPIHTNGQLSASADGGKVGGYTFNWYKGTTISSPAGPLLKNGNKLIGQGAGSYVVHVTTNLTGCASDKSGTITDKTITPPVPNPSVVFDRTNCINPNGWVTATVGGVTFNYSFNWFNGNTASGSPNFNGVDYRNRDIGPYTVTVTDQTTGCVSPPATVTVQDKRVTPEFTFTSTPSYCKDTGKTNGAGSIQLNLMSAVILDDVNWIDLSTNSSVGTGVEVYNLFPGTYQAEAITSEGCRNDGVAEVVTEISPYNGVSVNGDGQNDGFIIDCITNFPNNNVKIFNRNGIMVYEVNGYNNADFSFKGVGEKGVYLQGAQLPVGTYFYIIDKRNGSRPFSGYLELNR